MQLEVRNLDLSYDISVINNISFNLNNNEIITIIGKNGSGKTSLLESLLNIRGHYSGNIIYNNKDIKKYKNNFFRNIGIISYNFPFFEEFSLIYNLKYFLALDKINYDDKYIKDTLLKFDLLKHINRKISVLSTGLKIRLQITYNYLKKPEILLMDEPTAFIDPPGISYIESLISKIKNQNEFCKSAIIATHNINIIKKADNIILIVNGKNKITGNFEEILNKFKENYIVISDKYYNLLNNLPYNISGNRIIINKEDFYKLNPRPKTLEIKEDDIFEE